MRKLGYEVNYINSDSIKKIYLELTDRCNLDCTICYRKSWEKSYDDMSDEVYQSFIKNIKEINGLEEIVLGGIGEPTYYGSVLKALEDLKEYKLHITTNGTLLEEQLIEKIVECVDGITISVDGVDQYYKNIRGVSLDTVAAGIKKLQEAKKRLKKETPFLQLQFVASTENIDNISQVIDFAADLNCHRVVISSLIPQEYGNKDKILYTLENNTKLKEIWHKTRNYALRKGITVQLPNTHLKTERRCNFIDDITTYVTSNGDVTSCYRLSHDYEEYTFGRRKQVQKHSFGNILEESLLDIWNKKEYQQFRYIVHNNLYPSCMDCDLVEGCELTKSTFEDCYGCMPTCADCLWSRQFVVCP
ncbi:tungsten cofactor oxidoreductase radical SAM maturase [Alkaliphilus peptidifermentans]|uniref:Tungsten cofactor oxidoreducase radical SAM maturase n=1 Tax=Alkaliphilus peptidifermentans DSM 18978 TaxID=1120976 RepID=A0A1G5FKG3_9FIRM|nr:tungsten cofactor oxidoreductase radical SAM maturase [Alkaliphilus peptidifermentans]SCY39759.1 tungsten cofactor oxidoreducase radical SAM maturase [Alkaliphilus peptidifermentans DSM 18978]